MSVFCPNIKSEAWLKHTELVGNDLNYLSWIGNKGFAIQYTSKGKVSSLYSDLVKEYKDEKLAAKIKALTFSKSIIEKLGNVKKDSKGEYKIEDVKKLLTLSKQEDIQKSDSEILESIVDKYKIAPKVVFKEGKIVVDDIEYSQSGIISNAADYQLRVVNALLTLSAPQPLPVQSPTMTDQQLAAVQWTHQSTGNLILEAVAGSGKTFTIIEMLICNFSTNRTFSLLCFKS